MSMTKAELDALDRSDPLASFREECTLPEGVIYLDGNSLGPSPARTPGRLATVMQQEWCADLIRSSNNAGWMELPGLVGNKIGPLLGAPAATVMAADSTSVNLFKLLAAALGMRPECRIIVAEPPASRPTSTSPRD